MPYYLGFSTQQACQPRTTNATNGSSSGVGGTMKSIVWGKKFQLVDSDLVIQDFLNALSIKKGSKVGQPSYGSNLWNFLFEYNMLDSQRQIEAEVTRIASLDPRLILNSVRSYPSDNGILIEVEVAVTPFNQAQFVTFNFNTATNTAFIV